MEKLNGSGQAIITALKKYAMPLVLLVLVLFFASQSDKFLTWYNIRNMLIQSSYLIIAGVGLAFVMISGGIDLSVGYQASLVGVILGMLMRNYEFSPVTAISVCLLVGTLIGFLNGVLVVKLKVFSLIVTLGTATILQGVSYIISQSNTIIGFSKGFTFIGQGYIWEIPFPVILAVVCAVIAFFILSKTYFGRYVYAIGGNEEVVKLAGVNVDKIRIVLFGICGFFTAIATVVLVARAAAASSNMGPGIEFTILTAGILGGISFKGGEGSVGGMIVGILLLTVLGNGMQLMRLGVYPQYISQGFVLIAAVGFDTYQRNIKTKKVREGKKPDLAKSVSP